MKNLLTRATAAVMEHVPASISPENQYAKSLAAVLCLAVSAKRKYDLKEFEACAEFIEKDEVLRSEDLTQRTMVYFNVYCERMSECLPFGSLKFPAMQTELIAEARKCSTPYSLRLKDHVELIMRETDDIRRATLQRIAL